MNTLERLKELLQQATPGPLEFDGDFVNGKEDFVDQFFYSDESDIQNKAVNGAFIVTASNALPALLEGAEAAARWHKAKLTMRLTEGEEHKQATVEYFFASEGLSAALEKLEKEAPHED
jgi:hypothetical protein